MISHLYHQKYHLPPDVVIDFDNLHHLHADVPRILFTGVAAKDRAPSGGAWADEVLRAPKVVLLTRDPRDVAVSFYFQLTERASPRELARKGIRSLEKLQGMELADFLMDTRLGVPRVAHFLRDWEAAMDHHPNRLRVSYEEMREDTAGTFRRLACFIEPSVTDEEITAAIAFGEFSVMQAREQQGFFATDRLRSGGSGLPDSLKVRRGKIGGYRDYLTPEQAKAVDGLLAPAPAATPATDVIPPP